VINGELVVLNDMGALLFDRLRWRAVMLKDRGVASGRPTEALGVRGAAESL